MIQRIQSVYLTLGAVALLTLLFLDALWSSRAATAFAWFSPALVILAAVAALVAIGAVFLYKDRKKQRKVVLAAQTLTLVLAVVLCAGFFLADELVLLSGDTTGAGMIVPILLPIAAYVLFYLARRGIENDIALIRSMDRLR